MNETPVESPVEPQATDSTVHTGASPYRLPPFLLARRNRAKNRGRTDKFQRNQKAVRILRNAFKRGVEGISDTRPDIGDRDTYASCKPIFRGVKKGIREDDRNARVAEQMHDQRCREHVFQTTINKDLPEGPRSWDEIKASFQEYAKTLAVYHRLEPAAPYVNRGPQSDYLNKTGRYHGP